MKDFFKLCDVNDTIIRAIVLFTNNYFTFENNKNFTVINIIFYY